MNTYTIQGDKHYQVILRKKSGHNGVASKKFFASEEAAYEYINQNENEFYCELIDLKYFKAR